MILVNDKNLLSESTTEFENCLQIIIHKYFFFRFFFFFFHINIFLTLKIFIEYVLDKKIFQKRYQNCSILKFKGEVKYIAIYLFTNVRINFFFLPAIYFNFVLHTFSEKIQKSRF